MKWIQIQKRIFYYGQTKALVRGCSYACASVLVSEAYRSLLDPYASWTIVCLSRLILLIKNHHHMNEGQARFISLIRWLYKPIGSTRNLSSKYKILRCRYFPPSLHTNTRTNRKGFPKPMVHHKNSNWYQFSVGTTMTLRISVKKRRYTKWQRICEPFHQLITFVILLINGKGPKKWNTSKKEVL